MKAKHVFLTMGLALVMGAGIAASGVISMAKGMQPARAADTTIYCKMAQAWWKADGAAVGIYAWGEGGVKNAEWPGARMTAVEGEADTWKFDIDIATYPNVIFTRVNSSGTIADWGAKTADLEFPTDGKNLYTITSTSPVWGDPGCTGEWSVYPPTPDPDPEYHLLGDFNSWAADDDNLLTVDPEDANHYTIGDVAIDAEDELKVCDTANNIWYDNGSGNVVVAEAGTYDVDFYVQSDNPTHIVLHKQEVLPTFTLVNRGDAPITLELDDDDKPEGVLHQFSAQVQYACRGGRIQFYENGVEMTEHIGADQTNDNNIYGNATDGFRIYHTYNYTGYITVYLKTYSDGGRSVWATGYAENEFDTFVRTQEGNYGSWVTLSRNEDYEPNETYIEEYKSSSAVHIVALSGAGEYTSNLLDCSGLSESLTIDTAGDNNAKAAYQNSAWCVYNDCTEVIYLKVRRADLGLVLYVGGRTHTYTMTIAGNTVNLSSYNSETHEYYGTFGAVAGQTVTAINKDGDSQEFTVKQIGNNNLTSDKQIIVSGNQTAYFDTDDNVLYISGMAFGGYHIIKNAGTVDAEFIQMTHGDPWEGFDQYYSGAISFALNDTVTFVNTSSEDSLAVEFPINTINVGGNGDKFDIVDGKITCIEAVQTSVYMKLKYEADEVYFGSVEEYVQKAIDFAEAFVSDIETACSASEETRATAVKAAWDLKATAYAALGDDSKGVLQQRHESSIAEIRAFAQKYEEIYAKRATAYNLSNFMEWTGITPANSVNGLVINNNVLLITVIAVSTLAISAGLILFLLKRKRLVK